MEVRGIIMHRVDYIEEAKKQLSNTTFYQFLSSDPPTTYQKELCNVKKIKTYLQISGRAMDTLTPHFDNISVVHLEHFLNSHSL